MLTNVNGAFTLNFNLREPKANKKTNIYAVIKINGEQIKKPIDCKINPWNWDKKKQSPKFTKNMTEADTENAKQVLNIIYGLRINFNTYYLGIIAKKETPNKEELFNKVFSKKTNEIVTMKKEKPQSKREIKATSTLKKALELYSELNTVVQKTLDGYKNGVVTFENYCDKINKDSIKMLTDEGLKEFIIFQRSKGVNNSRIRTAVQRIKILVNKCITEHPHFKNFGVKKINIPLPKGDEIEGKADVILTYDEFLKLKNYDGKLNEWRDLFLLLIYTGQRASDIPKMLNGEYTEQNGYMVFYNKKKKHQTLVKLTDEVKEIQDRYKNGFKDVVFDKNFVAYLTAKLKTIGKEIGLDRQITYIINGETITKPLYEMLKSHMGRHTFITKKLAEKVPPLEVSFLSGHKGTKTLLSRYTHLTADDKINLLEQSKQDKQGDLIKETKEVLLMLGAEALQIADINDLDKLLPMLYIDYHKPLMDMGISTDKLKGLFNDQNLTLKQKHDIVEQWIEEFCSKKQD